MERTSYLIHEEVRAAQKLHRRAPYAISSISQSVFSIARLYGGMTYQGCAYTYFPEHDECVRDDVLKMVEKMRKKKPVEPEQGQQLSL